MTTMSTKLEDLKYIVWNAAKDGILSLLRLLLESRQKGEVEEIVSAKTNGATPLIVACWNGHIEVVQYLMDVCSADIEQMGFLCDNLDPMYPNVSGDVTPLWCAVARNHLDIVKLLVTRGADAAPATINPLMRAFMHRELNFLFVQDIVDNAATDVNSTNEQGQTWLMDSCTKANYKSVKYLIDRGADVHRKDLGGNTALHYCVMFYHTDHTARSMIDIMNLLMKCKAKMEKNSLGVTPLLSAAALGKIDIMIFFICVQSVHEIERTEKIDALELLGATCVAGSDMTSAVEYWRWAMEERFRVGSDVIQKPSQEPNAAYNNAVEVKTLDEVDDLISDPDAMQMQALVVRERILGLAYYNTIPCILACGVEYAARGSLDECFRLFRYALDMQQKYFEPVRREMEIILLFFARSFSQMIIQELHVEFDIIMHVLDKSVIELERSIECIEYIELDTDFNCILNLTLIIIGIMCRIQEGFSQEQVHKFKQTVYGFVKLNLRNWDGYTPLHIACEGENSSMRDTLIDDFVFPSADVAKILIELNASVDANDSVNGYTPLHVAAKGLKEDVMTVLLKGGAHIDASNLEGKTPMDLLHQNEDKIISPLAVKYQTLQCLAARVILANDIPYKGIVSQKVEDFVAMH